MSGVRIFTTRDGRYVPDGHPDAALLAYSEYDEPPGDVLQKLAGPAENNVDSADVSRLPSEGKSRAPQANKARSKPADK